MQPDLTFNPPESDLVHEIQMVERIITANLLAKEHSPEEIQKEIDEMTSTIHEEAVKNARIRHVLRQISPRKFSIDVNIVKDRLIAALVDRDSSKQKTIETTFDPAKENECFTVLKEILASLIRQILMLELEYPPLCHCSGGYIKKEGLISLCREPACMDYLKRSFCVEDKHLAEVTYRSPRPIDIFIL